MDAVVTAGEIVAEFVRQQDGEQRQGKWQAGENRRGVAIRETKGSKERIE